MFESSNFLCLRQVSSHGFLQINKYMENLAFHFSFFFLWEYYLYLNKCHRPVIECFSLSLLPWVKFSLKRPPFLRSLSLPVGSEARAVLRALTRWGHFYDSRGGGVLWVRISLTSCLCLMDPAEQQTFWACGSGVRHFWAEAPLSRPAVSWWAEAGHDSWGLCLACVSFIMVSTACPWRWWRRWRHSFSLREGLGSQCSSLFLSA